MAGWTGSLDADRIRAEGRPRGDWFSPAAMVLAGTAIISSAFHFWPLQQNDTYRMFCLPNMAVLAWSAVIAGYCLSKRGRGVVAGLLPDSSVLAYVLLNILSVAFAAETGRAVSFAAKLALMLIGGYLLFGSAISGIGSLRVVYGFIVGATVITVSYCLLSKYGFCSAEAGFFGSVYKYGTYVGTLTPLCAAYLFMSSRDWQRLFGAALVIGTLISSDSLGAVAAISAGLLLSIVFVPRWSVKICMLACLVFGIGVLMLPGSRRAGEHLCQDVRLTETDGANLKQRYIEWQAELNLLGERSATGTGAGCINEYRSNFYYRLPKLNTLEPFDQNGWLAAGAETGILGLVCFCWIVAHYFGLAWSQVSRASEIAPAAARRFATANFVGLACACVAHAFSSLHYNGVLVVFVLVLVLISRTNLLFRRQLQWQ